MNIKMNEKSADVKSNSNENQSESLDSNQFSDSNIIPKELNGLLNLPPVNTNPNNYYYQQQFPYNNYQSGQPVPFYNLSNPNFYQQNGSNHYHPNWNNNSHHRKNLPYQYNNSSMPTIISKMAEDKMKPAFKSIEMILETFNSINMILDSTYSTLYGSFRTITGVADHLIFIRNHLTELALFPRLACTLINLIKWMFKFLGLNHTKLGEMFERQINNDIWREAMSSSNAIKIPVSESSGDDKPHSSLWPVMAFFSLIFGTPYIVWRLLGATGQIPRINQPDWTTKNGRHFVAIGLQNFKARNMNELNFRKGQMIYIKPESLQPDSKWLVACTINEDGKKPVQIGVIPLNLVKLLMNK